MSGLSVSLPTHKKILTRYEMMANSNRLACSSQTEFKIGSGIAELQGCCRRGLGDWGNCRIGHP